ncbi:MAG: hypothetical protein J6Q05_01290 [Elusimicrobiaceae bacterium]|nr:hypothetical protein [Elusimicrobiaceae bacterium]
MKKLLILLCFMYPLGLAAETVHSITAETTRMSPDTLKKRFNLKEGEKFTEREYQKAQEELHKLRVFKTLEFIEEKRKHGVDIHIKADDRSYVFPMAFAMSGKKHSMGLSLASGNLLKQGETAFLFAGRSRDGFATHGGLVLGNDSFFFNYFHIDFEQSFYSNGWMSIPDLFSAADDKGNYNNFLLGTINGKQDDFSFTYRRKFSSVWSAFITPQYEYYRYQGGKLDSGNHSRVSFGFQYADDIRPDMNMGALSGIGLSDKAQALRDLPRIRTGKLAQVSYTMGGSWTGSDYDIQKLSLGGGYMWEFKDRNLLALFVKAQRAFDVPFSNLINSSDLLFGMGIYDREQRGKGGVSVGVSFTYFILRNQLGLLSLMPFFEQAYITSGGNSYQPHAGVGATLTYRFWRFPLPIGLNYTHNINDGSHHFGVKVGGRF